MRRGAVVQLKVIQKVFGMLLMLFSTSMLPPLLVSLAYADGVHRSFAIAYGVTLIIGGLLWFPVRHRQAELQVRDGFLVVALFWVVLGLSGALPFALSPELSMSVTDSVFESLSGLTTTGATVMEGLDDLPRSIAYYRQQLQWLGGMGVIVLAVAILPMLGIGGMQLYKAETPGPVKNSRLTARITETAKALWYIYVGLTVACALAYWAAGMTLFDAVAHSFSTVSTGGFSTHDASMAFFDSPLIEAICVIFMVLAGVNFSLHFMAIRTATLQPYRHDAEFRAYLAMLLVISVICVCYLLLIDSNRGLDSAIRRGVFQVVSIATTTGFTTDAYHLWPGALPIMLLLLSFVGGCGGSTAGGMKVIRVLLVYKQAVREVVQLVHPHAIVPVRVGREVLSDRMIQSVWGFFGLYVISFSAIYMLLAISEPDLITAFSAVAACMNNLGPGLGEVGTTFATVSDMGKWLLCFAMLLGRLEVFTLLVLFSRAFWRN
ncbi:MAG: TrkH family potassium uptake protein [Gammaproteobacteria bacterium]|nr:TrkH family potassium uptake protein [Gammaproteobacteria bacterium]